MAVLPLTKGHGNPILRKRSIDVKSVDRKIKQLIKDMISTMDHANGLGIAAPQVGVNLRIFIARLNYDTGSEMSIPMINSRITQKSDEMESGEEGCLSLPKRFGMVPRHKSLTVEYMDINGKRHILKLKGLNARIVQHETDHIEGMLFIDRMESEISPDDVEAVE